MARCVYCLKNEEETTFAHREHVMPQFLGTFSPLNPVLVGDLVCDTCNHAFSPFERNFHEDSEEGITGQMLNIDNRHSVRLRGKNVKMVTSNGIGVDMLDQVFPFFKREAERLVVELKPQVQLRNYDGVYQVFLPEALRVIKKDGREFRDVKKRIAGLQQKDIRIFAPADHAGDEAAFSSVVALLVDFGITYKEGEKAFSAIEKREGTPFEISMECTVNRDIGRVLAKIAFNYFAYCANTSQKSDILFGENFDRIRQFIRGDESIALKDVVISLDKDVILGEERDGQKRLLAHVVVFEEVNGQIIAKLSFWGRRIYEIAIGAIPSDLSVRNFGCGHVFDPFKQRIHNISQQPKHDVAEDELRATFGLEKKIR